MSKELEKLKKQAVAFNVTVEDNDTIETLTVKLGPIQSAIEEAKVKASEEAIQEADPKNHGVITLDKKKYQFTVAEFSFMGKKYKSEELSIEAHADIIKTLIEVKSFVLKSKN